MKNLKKIICTVMALCTVALTGCGSCVSTNYTDYEFETDGTYYYHLGENGYHVAGLKDETQEILYIPAYFNGKTVVKMGVLYSSRLWTDSYRYSTIINYNLKQIYYPYTMSYYDCAVGYSGDSEPTYDRIRSFAKETFFASFEVSKYKIECILEGYYDQTKDLNKIIEPAYVYVTREFLERKYGKDLNYKQKIDIESEEMAEDSFEAYVQIANTAYFFNYEEAPNEGYFFINNFEYGGLIEDTPYKPIREGYEFAGWYKEPECVNKWDFEKDRLHEEKYDEEGNFVFEELNLYAKWVKK